jgi:hypothetical protein
MNRVSKALFLTAAAFTGMQTQAVAQASLERRVEATLTDCCNNGAAWMVYRAGEDGNSGVYVAQRNSYDEKANIFISGQIAFFLNDGTISYTRTTGRSDTAATYKTVGYELTVLRETIASALGSPPNFLDPRLVLKTDDILEKLEKGTKVSSWRSELGAVSLDQDHCLAVSGPILLYSHPDSLIPGATFQYSLSPDPQNSLMPSKILVGDYQPYLQTLELDSEGNLLSDSGGNMPGDPAPLDGVRKMQRAIQLGVAGLSITYPAP